MKVRALPCLVALAAAMLVVGAGPAAGTTGKIGTISISPSGIVLPGGTAAIVPFSYTCTTKRGFPNFFVMMVQKSATGQILSGFSDEPSPPGPICDGASHTTRALIAAGVESPGPGWASSVASVTAQLEISNNQGESAAVSAVRAVQLKPGSFRSPVSVISASVLARGAAVQATVKYPCNLADNFLPVTIGYLGSVSGGLLQESSILGAAPAACTGSSGTFTFQAVPLRKAWAAGPALISYPGGMVALTLPVSGPPVPTSGSSVIRGVVVAGGAASLLDVSTTCTPGANPGFVQLDLYQAESDGNVVHYNGGNGFCPKAGVARAAVLPAFDNSYDSAIASEPLSATSALVVSGQLSGSLGSVLTLSSGTAAHSVSGIVLPTSIASLANGAALSFLVGYTCPASNTFGLEVTVSQVVGTHRAQSLSVNPDSPCTGAPRTAEVSMLGGPYSWGNRPAFLEVGTDAGTSWQTVPITSASPPGRGACRSGGENRLLLKC